MLSTVPIEEIKRLLNRDEALVTLVVGKSSTVLWVLRNERYLFATLPVGQKEIPDDVKALRASLDPQRWEKGKIKPFDLGVAFGLYKKILAPAEKLLSGANHVLIVPDGALQSVPLGVLVTEELKQTGDEFSDYRAASWLAKRYPMTVLPAVSSLQALRRYSETAKSAPKPVVGIGDPILNGKIADTRTIRLAQRGGQPDVSRFEIYQICLRVHGSCAPLLIALAGARKTCS